MNRIWTDFLTDRCVNGLKPADNALGRMAESALA